MRSRIAGLILALLALAGSAQAQTIKYMSGLAAGAAVSSTDTLPLCQTALGCGVGVPLVVETITQLTTYFNANLSLNASAITAGTLPIARGGTGAASLTGNGMAIVNAGGTALSTLAPGANNNCAVSNGTIWTSAACPGGSLTLTDGTHTVSGTTQITVTGGTVGGSTPNATLTISAGSGLTVGTTTIGSGTTTRVLFDNAGVLGEYTISGSGNVVMTTSPTISGLTVTGSLAATGLVTYADVVNGTGNNLLRSNTGAAPSELTAGTGVITALGVNVGSAGAFVVNGGALGTPSSGTLTNATGLPAASVVAGALANGMTATTQSALDNSTKVGTTAYTDAAVAAAISGVNPATSVSAATTQASDTSSYVYANGVAGIGATLTGPTNNVAVVIDGFTFTAVGQRLLVKNDTQSPSGAFNGVYSLTILQGAANTPVLTRSLDYDTPSDINSTGTVPVINGTSNANTSWILTTNVTTVGTDPLTYAQFSYAPSSILLNTVAREEAVGWVATVNPNNATIFIAKNASTVRSIIGDVETATGGAATVTVNKASSGTACSAGTALHSGSFNANGTAATNQTLTITTSSLSAGDRVCLQTTGTTSWTTGTGIGGITVSITTP